MASAPGEPTLKRWVSGDGSDWVLPAFVAALWMVLLWSAKAAPLGLQRTVVALGGPAVMLAGLHARLFPYLHAPSRLQTLVLPIAARSHFCAARSAHRRAQLRTTLLGTLALVLVLREGLTSPTGLGLLGDWLAFAIAAAGVEPLVPAVSAWLGRRFPADSPLTRLQHGLGGGWTLPEAVVHLYAPALGLGFAMMLALPAQLACDRFVDGLSSPPALLWTALVGFLVAFALPVVAPFLYARGVFQAVPFLAEATKTLAGPPVPERAPAWLGLLRDPLLRLWVLQFYRLTPVPMLRLFVLILAVPIAWNVDSVTVGAAVLASSFALWLLPAYGLRRLQRARARLLQPLPVGEAQRSGRHPLALAMLCAPPVCASVFATLAWSLR